MTILFSDRWIEENCEEFRPVNFRMQDEMTMGFDNVDPVTNMANLIVSLPPEVSEKQKEVLLIRAKAMAKISNMGEDSLRNMSDPIVPDSVKQPVLFGRKGKIVEGFPVQGTELDRQLKQAYLNRLDVIGNLPVPQLPYDVVNSEVLNMVRNEIRARESEFLGMEERRAIRERAVQRQQAYNDAINVKADILLKDILGETTQETMVDRFIEKFDMDQELLLELREAQKTKGGFATFLRRDIDRNLPPSQRREIETEKIGRIINILQRHIRLTNPQLEAIKSTFNDNLTEIQKNAKLIKIMTKKDELKKYANPNNPEENLFEVAQRTMSEYRERFNLSLKKEYDDNVKNIFGADFVAELEESSARDKFLQTRREELEKELGDRAEADMIARAEIEAGGAILEDYLFQPNPAGESPIEEIIRQTFEEVSEEME